MVIGHWHLHCTGVLLKLLVILLVTMWRNGCHGHHCAGTGNAGCHCAPAAGTAAIIIIAICIIVIIKAAQ